MKNLDEMVKELNMKRRDDQTMDEDLRKAAESTKSDIDRAFRKLGKTTAKLKQTKAA